MTDSLKTIFRAIAQCDSQLELQQIAIAKIGEYFAAKRCRLFWLSQLPSLAQKSQLLKTAISLEHNPVLRYLAEHHVPVHEGTIVTPGKWQAICPRFDHGHVMVGPIVDDGDLIGGLALTRDRQAVAFSQSDLGDLSALCLHLSTRLIKLKTPQPSFKPECLELITPRELEIAELVAQGMTNAEIGKRLWITENSVKQALKRMFRKLQVSSRAEAIAKLLTYQK